MTGDKKRRQKHLRKTKAQLIDELAALEHELGQLKRGKKPPAADSSGLSLENQALFRAVIDNSPAAILLKDTEGRFLGSLDMPAKFQPLRFYGNRIYGIGRDELDVQYVMRFRIDGIPTGDTGAVPIAGGSE